MVRWNPLRAAAWLCAALLLPSAPAAAAAPLKVVCSFTIIADLARQVGGDAVDVVSLVGPNADAHDFEPSPGNARTVADADLVIANGLGLDAWLDRLAKSAGYAGPVVVATKGVATILGEDHGHKGTDPHAWQAVGNARLYARNIAEAIAAKNPAAADAVRHRAAAYDERLAALDEEVRAEIGKIPPERRILVTTHDAFGYFAKTYGVTMLAAQGLSTDSEPSAKAVASLIRQIKARKATAVFLENMSNPQLMRRIAKESGATIGGELFADALSKPGEAAATYVEMMQYNAHTLATALAK